MRHQTLIIRFQRDDSAGLRGQILHPLSGWQAAFASAAELWTALSVWLGELPPAWPGAPAAEAAGPRSEDEDA